jgi:uncharacterized MAPEG superfamily protein
MNLLICCLLIACILPYLAKIPLAKAQARAGGYDNNHPREQQGRLVGFGARALAAHQNSFESLIVFGIAVVSAIATSTVTTLIENLAVIHIVSRVIYHILYLMNLAALRSLIWTVGLLCSLTILGLCIS